MWIAEANRRRGEPRRAIADHLQSEIKMPVRILPWQDRFVAIAKSYQGVARHYPRAFALPLRYCSAGLSDLKISLECECALLDAGLTVQNIPAKSLALYASVLRVCASEIGTLLSRPMSPDHLVVRQQPSLPLTKKFDDCRLCRKCRGLGRRHSYSLGLHRCAI